MVEKMPFFPKKALKMPGWQRWLSDRNRYIYWLLDCESIFLLQAPLSSQRGAQTKKSAKNIREFGVRRRRRGGRESYRATIKPFPALQSREEEEEEG